MSAALEALFEARRAVRAAACKVELAELGMTDVDSSVTVLREREDALDAAAARLAEARRELDAQQAAGGTR